MPDEVTHTGEHAPVSFSAKLSWRDAESEPVHVGNQFLLQRTGNNYLLSIGQVFPPAIVDPTQEEIEALQGQEIKVKVLSRVMLSRNGTQALMELIQRVLDRDLNPDVEEQNDVG